MSDINDVTLRSRIFSEALRQYRDDVQRRVIRGLNLELNFFPLSDFMIGESAWEHAASLDVDPKLIFAHPDVLIARPTTSLYYRGLALLSQKQVSQHAVSITKWEDETSKRRVPLDKAIEVARFYNTMISSIIEVSSDWTMQDGYRNIVATMAVSIDGSFRNRIGKMAEDLVKGKIVDWLNESELIESIITQGHYLLPNNTLMKFGSEPDINFVRNRKSVATVEIKGGRDPAGALERHGAMTKSFMETPPDCVNFLIAGVITPEQRKRLNAIGVVKLFELDDILGDGVSWDKFTTELFHYILRVY